MRKELLILYVFLATVTLFELAPCAVWANPGDSDDPETIRQAERLHKIEDAQRAEKMKKYDENHQAPGGGDFITGCFCLFVVVTVIGTILKHTGCSEKALGLIAIGAVVAIVIVLLSAIPGPSDPAGQNETPETHVSSPDEQSPQNAVSSQNRKENGYDWNRDSDSQKSEVCLRFATQSTNNLSADVFSNAFDEQYNGSDPGRLGLSFLWIATSLESRAAAAKTAAILRRKEEENRHEAEIKTMESKIEGFNADKDGAEKGYVSYELSLGLRYLNGDGVGKNPELGEHWLEKASLQGDIDARIALIALSNNIPILDKSIMRELKYAEQDADAYQYKLGMRFLDGDGVPENKAIAKGWLQRAAASGNAAAKTALSNFDQ